MKIRPDNHNPQNFVLSDVAAQELKNIVEMVKTTNWRLTPWGKSIIERFEAAVEDNDVFFYETEW